MSIYNDGAGLGLILGRFSIHIGALHVCTERHIYLFGRQVCWSFERDDGR